MERSGETQARRVLRDYTLKYQSRWISSTLWTPSQKQAYLSPTSTSGMSELPNKDQIRSYKSFVTAQTQRNSCLQNLSEFFENDTVNQHACRIVCLEFYSSSGPPSHRSFDLDGLTLMLRNTVKENDDICGRLLVVEDLSSDVVETLGSLLNIDPIFFASHIDTFQIDIATARPSANTLPSTKRSQNFLNLHYHRVLEFENLESKQGLLRDMNVPQKVVILPQLKGTNVALARHCCSILKTDKDGLWLGKEISSITQIFKHGDLYLNRTSSCRPSY